MALPAATYTQYAGIGIREDLSDIVWDISPMDTPVMSNISRTNATQVFHEWQTDTLAAASATNKTLEGDDATANTATATVRLGNYCQIADKVVIVSGTFRASDTAGRADEFDYQQMKRSRELKRDIESTITGSQAADNGSAATARACAGMGAWLWTNQVKTGDTQTTVTVTSGAPSTAPTDGTANTLTEANLKSMLKSCWDEGGDPSLILVGSFNKQLASSQFSGIGTQYRDVQPNPMAPGSVVGAVDLYISDFGTHQLVASRFSDSNVLFGIDLEYWKLAFLRPINSRRLGITGDNDKAQILAEFTLEACEPDSSGKVYSLTTS